MATSWRPTASWPHVRSHYLEEEQKACKTVNVKSMFYTFFAPPLLHAHKKFLHPSVSQGQKTSLGPELPHLPPQCVPQGESHFHVSSIKSGAKEVMKFIVDVLSSFFVSCENIICKLCKIIVLANPNMHLLNRLFAAACCNRCLVNVQCVSFQIS